MTPSVPVLLISLYKSPYAVDPHPKSFALRAIHYPQIQKRGKVKKKNELREEKMFGDQRLDARWEQLMEKLSERPQGTLPPTLKRWSELKAAYRFLK